MGQLSSVGRREQKHCRSAPVTGPALSLEWELFNEMSVIWIAPGLAWVGVCDGLYASLGLKLLWTYWNLIGPLFKVYWSRQDTGGAQSTTSLFQRSQLIFSAFWNCHITVFLFGDQENLYLTRLYITVVKSHEMYAAIFPDFKRCGEDFVHLSRTKVQKFISFPLTITQLKQNQFTFTKLQIYLS